MEPTSPNASPSSDPSHDNRRPNTPYIPTQGFSDTSLNRPMEPVSLNAPSSNPSHDNRRPNTPYIPTQESSDTSLNHPMEPVFLNVPSSNPSHDNRRPNTPYIPTQGFASTSLNHPMEPVSLNASPLPDSHHDNRHLSTRYIPTQGFSDRVLRALRNHLLLLYRSDPDFYVLGATGNVYVVSLSTTLKCSCPDRATPCKHILFVLIKVLGLALDDSRLRRRTLRPHQLAQLLASPTSTESLAGPTLRERFQQALLTGRELLGAGHEPSIEVEEGAKCPICLEEMKKTEERLVSCRTCRNPLHEECLLAWKRSQRRRSVSCVICRSRWRVRADQERYLNLAAYVREDEVGPTYGGETACGE